MQSNLWLRSNPIEDKLEPCYFASIHAENLATRKLRNTALPSEIFVCQLERKSIPTMLKDYSFLVSKKINFQRLDCCSNEYVTLIFVCETRNQR